MPQFDHRDAFRRDSLSRGGEKWQALGESNPSSQIENLMS